ncbi:hypothetical protein R1flu_027034 [Riccia fluitans]|uniref:Transmembrane protein 131-like N-terminal domain-containing protein n=1 Tax=Riccia fluitans TaxID=41844 RepID=A0ABD1XKJ6_9MARC
MSALALVALFFCLPPQLFLFPAAQRCSVILPVLPVSSWPNPFSSVFSYACLVSFYGQAQEGVRKMRAHFGVAPILRSSGQSSQLSNRRRSRWCCWRAPRGSQLMLLFISWSLLLLLLGMPCLTRGASDLPKLDRVSGPFVGDLKDSRNFEPFLQTEGITAKRYRHGEPPPGRDGEDHLGKLSVNAGPQQSKIFSQRVSVVGDDQRVKSGEFRNHAGDSEGNVVKSDLGAVEQINFGSSLIRDCLKVKCSPAASFHMKQPSLEKTMSLISKFGSPTQGPVSSLPHVNIIPPFLEWGSQPMFAPSVVSLTVVNTCNSTGLKVFQPFSTDAQFYTHGFEEKEVGPGGELSIPVVFLPRTLGVAEAMLIVQTSAGGFLVQAQGRGISSPYKVQAFQGLRVASGESLQQTISLHNPYNEALRVGGIYAWPAEGDDGRPCEKNSVSSGISHCIYETEMGGAQLLTGEKRSLKGLNGGAAVIQMSSHGQLEIGPHSRISIADFEFSALKADRYSGSLHISLSRDSPDSADVLVLPLDVQVGDLGVDTSPVVPVPDVLEFGILTKEDQTSTVVVTLYNPGKESVQVEEISVLVEDKNIVHIEYMGHLVLQPNCETEVAKVTYSGKEETVPAGLFRCHPRELMRNRKLVVRTNNSVSPEVEVPYRALVFHGSVNCHPSQGSVSFVPRGNDVNSEGMSVLEDDGREEQRIQFANGLSVPLAIYKDLEKRAQLVAQVDTESTNTLDSDCCMETSMGELSILEQTELIYPPVQIDTEELLWLNVTNPSESRIYVQVFVGTSAEAGHRRCQRMDLYPVDPSCFIGLVSDALDVKLKCDLFSDVFLLAEGAVAEMIVEAHETVSLGPVIFRPTERFLWTGLLAVLNNLTTVEWVPLQGSGVSASLTFFEGDSPISLLQLDLNETQLNPFLNGLREERVAGFLDSDKAKAICSQRVSRGFLAKNTGDIYLDVKTVELAGGGCAANGFEVDTCEGFMLAPGQSAELHVSYRPDFTGEVFRRDLRLITSAGVIELPLLANLPQNILPLCSQISQSTLWEEAFLFLAIVALCVVLGVFFKMLAQEISQSQDQVSSNGLKSASQAKAGSRMISPVPFSLNHTVLLTNANNTSVVSGRPKSDTETQSRTGDGTGASGPGRPKESLKGLFRALKRIGTYDAKVDTVTASVGPTTLGCEDDKTDLAPSIGLTGLRVKVPLPSGLSTSKSSLASPVKEAVSSPSSTSARKPGVEKKTQVARVDILQAKVAPEPLDEVIPAPVKQAPALKSPKQGACNNTSSTCGKSAEVEVLPQKCAPPTLTLPINSGLMTGSSLVSPRKGNQFTQYRQVSSPNSSQPLSPSQPAASGEKDKGKRKKRRNNAVKLDPVSKGRSGSSSPSSSPASPATPASPSRPISPLLHPELPSTGLPNPKSFGGSRVTSVTPLSKLDVDVERRGPTARHSLGVIREPANPPAYRRNESLSVDIASTALREMAKATDLSWSALSGRGSRSAEEKSYHVTMGSRGTSKDWVTVARKATTADPVPDKGDAPDDVGWDRRTWISNGNSSLAGPVLTSSATFPRRYDRGSGWNIPASVDHENEWLKPTGGCSSPLVPVSTMPPAARAPGAKIGKPIPQSITVDNGGDRDMGWGSVGRKYGQDGSTSWGEILDKKGSQGLGRNSDGLVYDIWGDHFGEISRCSTQQSGSARDVTYQNSPGVETTTSFFSSYAQPNFPSTDSRVQSPLSGGSSGFSVFSQAQDLGPVEAFSISSTAYGVPKPAIPRNSVFPDFCSTVNYGNARTSLQGSHSFSTSLPGSPRKARAPYSPPLGPSPMSSEQSPVVTPEVTPTDNSCSFWSSSNLQEVFTATVQSRS